MHVCVPCAQNCLCLLACVAGPELSATFGDSLLPQVCVKRIQFHRGLLLQKL